MRIIHADRRLTLRAGGRAETSEIVSYLKAGCGYGGSCLPKDLSALIAAGEARGNELPLLNAVREVNESQPGRVVSATEEALGSLRGRQVAVLGVAFKGGTDDLRASPGLRIVEELLERGALVTVYDPLVGSAALEERLGEGAVRTEDTAALAVRDAEACLVTTNAPEVVAFGDALDAGSYPDLVVVDGRRALAPDRVGEAVYLAVGRAPTLGRPGFALEQLVLTAAKADDRGVLVELDRV